MGGKGHCGPVLTDTLDATAADRESGPDQQVRGLPIFVASSRF